MQAATHSLLTHASSRDPRLEILRHIVHHNPLSQTLHDSRLAHTRLCKKRNKGREVGETKEMG